MIDIPLQPIANQELSIPLNGARYVITIKEANGVMVASITRDDVVVVSNTRIVADGLLLPYRAQWFGQGNFMMGVQDEEVPYFDKFGGIVGIAKSVGGAISGALATVKGALGIKGPDGGLRQEGGATGPYGAATAVPGLAEGKAQLGGISGSPIGTQSAAATGARTSNRTTNVEVGQVNVQTQATDAAGISKTIGDSMGAQLRQAASNYDDGVAA